MAIFWKDLKTEIEAEIKKIGGTCPNEIKRFHYGLITHSDAGKYSKNDYFTHQTHAYACYFIYTLDILSSIGRLAANPDFGLAEAKMMFEDISLTQSGNMYVLITYGGQKSLGKFIHSMVDAFKTINTRDEFVELLDTFGAYVSRLWAWMHWYYPWGIGPAVFQRVESEDLEEMQRLIKEA